MLDMHSHILPGMDDGSKDTQESCAMLRLLAQQGVDTVAATSHFDARRESVDSFLQRRRAALERLQPALTADMPRILLGAEVRYFEGISRMPDLQLLCLEGTNLLLLEMPMGHWTERIRREVLYLSCSGTLRIVIAHVERCMDRQDPDTLNRLLQNGVLFQANASYFLRLSTRRRALMQLRQGMLHLLGSDCHNLNSRPPQIGDACKRIVRRLGADFLEQMHMFSHSLLLQL